MKSCWLLFSEAADDVTEAPDGDSNLDSDDQPEKDEHVISKLVLAQDSLKMQQHLTWRHAHSVSFKTDFDSFVYYAFPL